VKHNIYIGERKRLGEYKGSGGRVQREAEYRSKKTREVINNRKNFRRRKLLEKYIVKMLYR